MTLDQIEAGRTALVTEIIGGFRIRQRLNCLGLHRGDRIRVKRSGIMGGPILVELNGTEVAIGRGMAKKIVVTLS
ncbi:MAG TPA: ferrous iron transport protein A [bacterium]|nr:ferrous iron transport protein A [bacterium]